MSIAEKMAVLAGGRSIDLAKPSKEQQLAKDRVEEILATSRREFRRRQRARQHSDPEAQEKGALSPLTGDDYTYQHGRQNGGRRYSELGQDLLQAMAGCPAMGQAMVLVRYAQDRSRQSMALYEFYALAEEVFIANRWHTKDADKGRDIIRSMCNLAFFECTDPKCGRCGGRGHGPRGGRCRTCKGSGDLQITDQDRATAIGVTKKAFWKTHRNRYRAVLNMLRKMEADTLEEMAARIYG